MTIREHRKKRGVTQFELSRRTRIHQSELSRIENGRLRPTKAQLERIADAFGVEPQKLDESKDVLP